MVLALLLPMALTAGEVPVPDLARFAPATTGLYVELHDGAELLVRLLEPSLWLTLAELAGQPASDEEAAVWRERIRAATQLEPAEAVRVLFADEVAYVGEGLGRSLDAVVLCKPTRPLGDLLQTWRAESYGERGPVRLLRLPNRMGLAVRDGVLAFGDMNGPDGMFARVVACLAEEQADSLVSRPEFAALLRRVPERLDGLVYVRFAPPLAEGGASDPQPATAPAAAQLGPPAGVTDPQPARTPSRTRGGPLAGASAVLIGLERTRDTLLLTAVGEQHKAMPSAAPTPGSPAEPAVLSAPADTADTVDTVAPVEPESQVDPAAKLDPVARAAPVSEADQVSQASLARPRATDANAGLLETLPERTLLACELPLDYQALSGAVAALPPQNVLRIFQTLHEQSGGLSRLLAQLEPRVCFALGVVIPEERRIEAPPIPAVAVLLSLRSEAAVDEWENLFHSSASIFNLLVLKLGFRVALPGVESLQVGDVRVEQLDLSGLLGARPQDTPLGALHLSWAECDGVLVLATHTDWLRQIVAARRGRGPTLAGRLDGPPPDGELRVFVQTGPIADLGEHWLEFFRERQPEVLQESWWRDYQPGGGVMRLGVAVRVETPLNVLRVEAVLPHHPADGLLRTGDAILGAERQRFATSQPAAELQQMVAARPNSRWLDLIIQRDGLVQVRRVPLPFVDPIQLMRRAAGIGQIVQRAMYREEHASSGARGVLKLELRRSPEPLYEFPLSPRLQPVSTPSDGSADSGPSRSDTDPQPGRPD